VCIVIAKKLALSCDRTIAKGVATVPSSLHPAVPLTGWPRQQHLHTFWQGHVACGMWPRIHACFGSGEGLIGERGYTHRALESAR
jgi:hypothetical protein